MHQVHSLGQPACPGVPRRVCRDRVVGTPRPCRGLGRPCRGLAPRPCRSVGGRVVVLCRAQARSCRGPVSRHSLASSPLSGHDTNFVSRPIPLPIKPPQPFSLSRYTQLYRDTPSQLSQPQSRYKFCIVTQHLSQARPPSSLTMSKYNGCIVTQCPC